MKSMAPLLAALPLLLLQSALGLHAPPRAARARAAAAENASAVDAARASCRESCGCAATNLAFVAKTDEARQLYKGCTATAFATPLRKQPALVVVGVQKGGTTTFRFAGKGFCGPHEAHFFDNPMWLEHKPARRELEKNYLANWDECGDHAWMEKTPGYYWAPSAPLRTCEAFPDLQLMVLLREPVARAYSSFWNCNTKYGAIEQTPQGFHTVATMDIALANECGGMPLGDPASDLAVAEDYKTCCLGVAQRLLNRSSWPACECKPKGKQPHNCARPYGAKDFAVVRQGLYARLLRNWYRYHRSDKVLVLYSEDFFRDENNAVCEVRCHSLPEHFRCSGDLERKAPPVTLTPIHTNSWVAGHPPMLPETRKLLEDFYRPHNEDLFQLLGRRAPWG